MSASEWDREENGPETAALFENTTIGPAQYGGLILDGSSAPFVYHCPVHGEVEHTMGVSIEGVDSADYCLRCIIGKMDELIGRVERVNNDN